MIEIERKFLVRGAAWRPDVHKAQRIEQGYLDTTGATVRVRIRDDQAFLTVKGPTKGISRLEYQYPVPVQDAREMLDELCGVTIRKTRHRIMVGPHEWVIDEFDGTHSGLVMAEIELTSEDEAFEVPAWAGREVSDDARYYNSNLIGQTTPPTE